MHHGASPLWKESQHWWVGLVRCLQGCDGVQQLSGQGIAAIRVKQKKALKAWISKEDIFAVSQTLLLLVVVLCSLKGNTLLILAQG